jgi:hypothetical protein
MISQLNGLQFRDKFMLEGACLRDEFTIKWTMDKGQVHA